MQNGVAITMTGVDVRTDLHALPDGIEIGLLFTTTPEGRSRYPGRRELEGMLRALDGRKLALHVCGLRARDELQRGALGDLTRRVQRVQVNGLLSQWEVRNICGQHPRHVIITQHTAANSHLVGLEIENHAVLVDGSGGRGISPAAWARPVTRKAVGFAGGLGPDNIACEVARIRAVACGDWWIDMEGKLRDEDDWFDVRRACAVMSGVNG